PLWVKSNIEEGVADVRFTPESGHWLSVSGCPLYATSGHPGRLFQAGYARADRVSFVNAAASTVQIRSLISGAACLTLWQGARSGRSCRAAACRCGVGQPACAAEWTGASP